ncbi:hypothetical protein [Methylobacter sp.]|jgi:hypothetical protein|uniref:hypothetical protein n=1 Tax=Methylobacter sp. TaxID=2051955 RepID=UPI003DA1E859
MKIKQFAILSSVASALTLVISGLAMAAAPNYTFTTDQIAVGNAERECSQLGDLLGKPFAYAHKWMESGVSDGTHNVNFYN